MATVARGLPDGGFYLEGVLDIPHHFDRFLIFSSIRKWKTAGSGRKDGGTASRGGSSSGGGLKDAFLGAVEVPGSGVSSRASSGAKGSAAASHCGSRAPGRKHDWKVPQGFCGWALKVNGWQVPKDGREGMTEIHRE